jgi:uncharacterized protein
MQASKIPLPEQMPPEAIAGCACFDAREYFEAHEHLEAAWRAESGMVRNFYRGILLVAVGYYHVQRRNYSGAKKVFTRARLCLQPFPDVCMGIDLVQLTLDFGAVEAAIDRIPADSSGGLALDAFKPIPWIQRP